LRPIRDQFRLRGPVDGFRNISVLVANEPRSCDDGRSAVRHEQTAKTCLTNALVNENRTRALYLLRKGRESRRERNISWSYTRRTLGGTRTSVLAIVHLSPSDLERINIYLNRHAIFVRVTTEAREFARHPRSVSDDFDFSLLEKNRFCVIISYAFR